MTDTPQSPDASDDADGPASAPPARDVDGLFDGPDWSSERRRRRRRSDGPSRQHATASTPIGEAASAPVDDLPAQGPRTDPFDGPQLRTPGSRRRVSIKSRRRRRTRRRVGIALIFCGGLLVVGGAWITVTGLMARSALNDVRGQLSTLRHQISSGDLDAARATANQMRAKADDARSLTEGPAWAVAAGLPGGGAFQTVRTVAAQVDYLADTVLPPLIEVSAKLDPKSLREPDGSINLTSIAASAPVLDRAVDQLASTVKAVDNTPADTQIGPVDRGRRQLLDELNRLDGTLTTASRAADVAPALLGGQGVKHYFVAFQNEAEMRGTGGLPGAFAIISVDHGKFSFDRFESDTTLSKVQVPDTVLDSTYTGLGQEFSSQQNLLFRAIYGNNPFVDYRNSNINPNFPYAAQIWMAMWKQYSGQTLDGAATLDPTALSYLLKVTGSATYGNGQKLTAANVVALTQQSVYQQYGTLDAPAQAQRKALLLEIAKAASTRIVDSKASTVALVKAGSKAVRQQRMLFYSADPGVEQVLARSAIGGAIPPDARAYAGLSVYNLGGNKLDYYLHRSIAWQARGCGASRTVTVTVTLRNEAPAGLPPYVTYRVGTPPPGAKPGDNELGVSLISTSGGKVDAVTVNGEAAPHVFYNNLLLHPYTTVSVELPRGTTATVVYTLTEPNRPGPVDVLRQPGVNPLQVTVDEPHCG